MEMSSFNFEELLIYCILDQNKEHIFLYRYPIAVLVKEYKISLSKRLVFSFKANMVEIIKDKRNFYGKIEVILRVF